MSRRHEAVASANQAVRDLRNRLHQIDQEQILPLRTRIAELERDNGVLQRRADRAERMSAVYQAAWEAHIRLLHELQLASGKGT